MSAKASAIDGTRASRKLERKSMNQNLNYKTVADLSTPTDLSTFIGWVIDKYRDVSTRDQPRQQTVDKSSNPVTHGGNK